MDETQRLQAELADLKTQLSEREMQTDELTKLNSTIQTQVDALIKELNVPKHIIELIAAKSPADQLERFPTGHGSPAGQGRSTAICSLFGPHRQFASKQQSRSPKAGDRRNM